MVRALAERLAEYRRNSTFWRFRNVDDTAPLCFSRVYQYIEAGDRPVEPKQLRPDGQGLGMVLLVLVSNVIMFIMIIV